MVKASIFKYLLGIVLTVSTIGISLCQENLEIPKSKNKISVIMGHSFVPQGVQEDGSKAVLFLASWGIDYDRFLNDKWGIGLHSDFIISNFKVEKIFKKEDIVIERDRPLTLCLVTSYKFNKHFSMQFGAGEEIAIEENFFVVRLGADVGWEISEYWEAGITFTNDIRPEAYNTTTLGFVFSRLF